MQRGRTPDSNPASLSDALPLSHLTPTTRLLYMTWSVLCHPFELCGTEKTIGTTEKGGIDSPDLNKYERLTI
jgi:hypothetical protein